MLYVMKKVVRKCIKRNANGQIIKGSSRLKGSGRPKGSKSTGKKIKSALNNKSSVHVNPNKSAGRSKNQNKFVPKRNISSNKGVKRNRKGQIISGSAGLPGAGRHTGTSKADRLEAIIAEVSAEPKRKEWLKDLIRRSYKSDALAIALLGRVYPALKAIEQTNIQADPAESRKKSLDIQKKLRKRMETRNKK